MCIRDREIPIVRTVIPSFPMEKKSQRQDTRTRKSVIKRLLPAQKQDIQGILTYLLYTSIESFNKTGPWSKSDKKVTITFKPTSKYYSIARTVTANIQVDGPEDYDGTIEIDEHPIVTTAVEETRQSLTIDLLKIDSETKQPISGALIGLYAANDIYDIDGNVLFEKDQLIQSMESDEAEDSHAVEFSNLPSDEMCIRDRM